MPIASVEVYLDDKVPEYMDGILRIGSVISYDSDGNELKNHHEFVDNTEFNGSDGSDARQEIIDYVAKHLGVHKDIVRVID